MDEKSVKVDGLMAVMKSDVPPYYRVYEITSIMEDGSVDTKRYPGMMFRPVLILPYDEEKIKVFEEMNHKYFEDYKKLCEDTKSAAEKFFNIEGDKKV